MKLLSDALDIFARTFFGALGGAIAMYFTVGILDQAFRPYPTDMQMWSAYALAIGVVLGSATAFAYALADKEKFGGAAVACLLIAIPLAALHLLALVPFHLRFPSVYEVLLSTPGLLWSVFLIWRGTRWLKEIRPRLHS